MNMPQDSHVKVMPLIAGLPGQALLILVPLALFVGYFSGYTELFLLVAVALSAISRKVLYKDWTRLLWDRSGSPFDQAILIKGLGPNTLQEIDDIVDSGKKVVFSVPSSRLLRRALHTYVRERLGVCRFAEGSFQNVMVEPEYIEREAFLLSMANRDALQRAINIMQKRGWKPEGDYRQASGLLNTVHTQRMQFN